MARKVVNVTGDDIKESKEVGRDFPPLPKGEYNVTVVDAEVRNFSEKAKYAGEEYYNVQLRVSEGDYFKRTLFAMVPLRTTWDKTENKVPTVFVPFFEALGYDMEGAFEVPEPEEIMGEDLVVKVRVSPDNYRRERGEPNAMRNDIVTFREYEEGEDPSPERTDTLQEEAPKAKPKRKAKAKKSDDDDGSWDL